MLRQTLLPAPRLEVGYLQLLIALIGTTISPYIQLYVQSSVVEKGVTPEEYRYTRFDVFAGTLFAGIVASFIIIATAATLLFPRGITIETAADAAVALEPVAGPYARLLFGMGLLGASLLAAGVLPLATTYVVGEALGFERGVSRSWRGANLYGPVHRPGGGGRAAGADPRPAADPGAGGCVCAQRLAAADRVVVRHPRAGQ